ncbi:hypothetical protein K1719_018427 [Acacia pycnantha]|nr:hypothetical protein K1719_018427 [Acacia pycnantha]
MTSGFGSKTSYFGNWHYRIKVHFASGARSRWPSVFSINPLFYSRAPKRELFYNRKKHTSGESSRFTLFGILYLVELSVDRRPPLSALGAASPASIEEIYWSLARRQCLCCCS